MKRNPAGTGFTLVELIVVMALLSVIALAMGSAMRSFATAEQRVGEHMLLEDDLRVTTSLLRNILARVAVKSIPDENSVASRLEFAGTEGELAWVGVMPARLGAGGLYIFDLVVEQDAGGAVLALRFQPYVAPAQRSPARRPDRRVLIDDVDAFRLAYIDPDNPELSWIDAWPHADRLPSHVRVSIRRGTDSWPDIVVAFRPLLSGEGGGGAAVFGPFGK